MLDIADNVEVEAIRPQEAVVELVRHSYMVRHLEAMGAGASNLRQCAEVVNSVPVLCLKRPRFFFALPNIEVALKKSLGYIAC
ncbi:MAG: hypothetical protein WKF84_20570 [Pyrinomonadaceae bacterium]